MAEFSVTTHAPAISVNPNSTSFDNNSISGDVNNQTALDIAGQACQDINIVLRDIQGAAGTGNGSANVLGDCASGTAVLGKYNYLQGSVDITSASGAMVIDDLMQKISTSVQVAAQLLSTSNNRAKTASRILTQG